MRTLPVLAALLLSAAPASAAITTTPTTGVSGVSASDLLQTDLGTESSVGIVGFDSNPATQSVLRNGTLETAIATGARVMASAGDSITWTFDLTNAPYGFSLTQIDVYSHWQNDAGSAPDRASQDYTVQVASFDNLAVFDTLYSVSFDGNGTTVRVSATDPMDGVLASSVGAIRFQFAAGPLGNNAYREIDVFGVPSVPAPAALPAGLALLALGATRRRTR